MAEDDIAILSPGDGGVRFLGFVDPTEIRPDPENANLGTEEGMDALEKSLEKYGAGRSIVLDRNNVDIAGNKTLEKAVAKGFKIAMVETDGKTLIAVRRRDLDLMTDPTARELAYADNRIGEINLNWDLTQIVNDIRDRQIDLSAFWSQIELEDIIAHAEPPDLDALEAEFGAPQDRDTWPIVRISVPPDVHADYEREMSMRSGEDHEKFADIIDAARVRRVGE